MSTTGPTTIWSLPTVDLLRFADIEEARPVGLVTTTSALEAVGAHLRLPLAWRADVTEATTAHWDAMAGDMDRVAVIYAVGGGLAADAAKYLAARHDLPMVCIPTALSVDAFLTAASGIRADGCVRYIFTKPPDRLLVDFGVIAAAPPSIRAAGICDVLSIATGAWDWRYADAKQMNPAGMEYIPYVDQTAQAILQGALDCAEAAGRGDRDGLKQLLDCLALEVQLCNQIGHSRPEEGSEHYFAYAVENLMGHGLPHGDLVGPSIMLIASRQGIDAHPLQQALLSCHIALDRIPGDVVETTLAGLADYVRRHKLPYGIAHEL